MEWKTINNESTFYEIQELSDKERVLIFKYSPACTVSHVMKTLLQREWNAPVMNMKTYLVDVNIHRDISEKITQEYGIEHHSPQVLIIKNDKCIHTKSYGHIQFSDIKQFANKQ
jgi:bacillithiol system protein YtxJ